ncbi:MAG: hypothetical protein QXT28_09065 [Thermofilaceae archaeon]
MKRGVVCPRCGERGSLYVQRVGGRDYVYMRHRKGKSERRCYLGPADEYVAVQKVLGEVYAPLALRNVNDLDVGEVIANAVEAARLQAQRFFLLKQRERLAKLLEDLERARKEVALLVKDIREDLERLEEEGDVEGDLEWKWRELERGWG